MNYNKYINNIKKLCKNNTFMPNIAQIREEIQSKQYNNFEQRDYSGINFDEIFANSIEQVQNHIPMY